VIEPESLAHGREVGTGQAEPAQLPVEQLLSFGLVAGAVELVEPGAYFLARARAGEEAVRLHQPVPARLPGLGREDLHAVAAAQLVAERHDAAVDLGTTATMTDFGMHAVREVQWRGAGRQVDHLALRGQD